MNKCTVIVYRWCYTNTQVLQYSLHQVTFSNWTLLKITQWNILQTHDWQRENGSKDELWHTSWMNNGLESNYSQPLQHKLLPAKFHSIQFHIQNRIPYFALYCIHTHKPPLPPPTDQLTAVAYIILSISCTAGISSFSWQRTSMSRSLPK